MLRDKGLDSHGFRHGVVRQSKQTIKLEKSLCIPIIRGREIKPFQYFCPNSFYLTPYFEEKLISRQDSEKDYPLTYQYLVRFREKLDKRGESEWYSYYSPPTRIRKKAIICCRVAGKCTFAHFDMAKYTIHGSAFGIGFDDETIDERLLLLYLNSSTFWRQIETVMPPIGEKRRSIRISTLKELGRVHTTIIGGLGRRLGKISNFRQIEMIQFAF